MASEWTRATLEDVCATITDGAHLSPKEDPDGLPMASVKDLTRHGITLEGCKRISVSDFAKLKRQGCMPEFGDVLIAKDGNSALDTVCVHRLREEVVLLSSVAILRPNAKIDSDFLRYYLDAPQTRALLKASFRSGSAIPRVVLKDFRRAPVAFPPLREQRTIGRILGTLDDKIVLNRQLSETLEAMARALFKSWFVDCDPVRAKLEGRDPGLPESLADLFPATFEDSELGQIPSGWHVKTIGQVAARVGMGPFGSSIKVDSFVPEGVPVISGQHLRGVMMEDNAFNFVSDEHAWKLRAANVQRGDVVFTHAGNIGQVAFIPEKSRYERYVISQRQFFLRCDRTQLSPIFIALYFRSQKGRHRLLSNASSSGVPSIARPVTYLRSIPLVVPSSAVMRAFDNWVQPLFAQCERDRAEAGLHAALRDALLPRLTSGTLRVTGA